MTKQEILSKLAEIRQFNNLHLSFNEAEHKYYVDGVNKPSVSGLLDKLKTKEELEKFNSQEFQDFLKPFAEFGTFIHHETELIDRGMTIDPMEYTENEYVALERYISLTNKIKDEGYELIAIEMPLYSTKYDACGTIDRLYHNPKTGKVLLADIKTGSTRESHWYQQLTYKDILGEWSIPVDDITLISLKLKNKLPKFSTLKEDKRNDIYSVWSTLESLVKGK